MSVPKVQSVTSSAVVGEGPHWDHTDKVLYFVDILESQVRKYNPVTKKETIVKIGGSPVSFVIPIQDEKDKFVIGHGRNLAILTWDGVSSTPSNVECIATVDDEDGKRENRFNDGKADPTGRIWAGTMGPEPVALQITPNKGSLYSLTRDKRTTSHVSDVTCSNGLAWTTDCKTMYYIDSMTFTVDAFDFDAEKGKMSNRRTAFDFKANNVKGVPDGMAIDINGKLWVACFEGSQVIHVDPITGKLLKSVPIPASKVTSVTFGGSELDELYVTSAARGLSKDDKQAYPAAGCVFRVTGMGVKGFPGQAAIL